MAACGGVDEGDGSGVGAGGDEGGDVEEFVGGERDGFALAVEGGVGFAEATSGVHGNATMRHE